MPVFLSPTTAQILSPAYWVAQNVDANSTINVSNVANNYQITMTANSITITNTTTSTATTFTNANLGGGSFSQFVAFTGNNANSAVSGSVGLNSSGYIGGNGDDTFTDSGNLGGTLNGGGGDDTLHGGTGNNNLLGGGGNDTIYGGGGNDFIQGGNGSDTIFSDGSTGTIQGNNGNDNVHIGDTTGSISTDGGNGTNVLFVPLGSIITPWFPGATGGNVTLPGGGSVGYQNYNSVTIECFTAGTLIRTPSGDAPIETLSIGDMVSTLDNGARAISWIGRQTVPAQGNLAPISFAKGVIGNTRDLSVSPQHRMLIRNWRADLLFGEPEVLVAAKHLVNDKNICRVIGGKVTYVHIMFNQHEIVFAEGIPSESFYPGETSMSQMENAVRDEIYDIFPELEHGGLSSRFPPARPFLKAFEARALF